MLIPKRVKRRRQHRGKIKGQAQKGNKVAYGQYGLVAVEGARITSPPDRSRPYRHDAFHQARRSGLDRHIPAQAYHEAPPPNPVWVPVKAPSSTG